MMENKFDIFVGVQHSKYQTPGNFRYTKICQIKPGKVFSESFFQITNLFACGTFEGPIMVYSERNNSLSHVCLLCGHVSRITDIIQLDTSFVSASVDGDVFRWCNDDCSCISNFNKIVPVGDVRLSHHPFAKQCIWVYTVGFYAVLLDLDTGQKIRTIDTIGVTTVAVIEPKISLFVNTPVLCVLRFNVLTAYNKSFEKINSWSLGYSVEKKNFLCEYGFIQVEKDKWTLLSVQDLFSFCEDTIIGRTNDDAISLVKWINPSKFCISTYQAKFIIIILEVTKRDEYISVHKQSVIEIATEIPTFVNYFICTKNRILYRAEPEKINSISFKGKIYSNSKQKITKIYHVPRSSSARVVESDGKNGFYVRNWEKDGGLSLRHKTSARITAISSRESVTNKLEIIVGCSDGTVSFFSENTAKPFHVEVVFSSPIIGLGDLPMKIRGRPTLLVVGQDGSVALIKNTTVIMSYANYEFRINAVYYHAIDECIIVRREDYSYITFKITEPGPVMLSTFLPEKSILVWSENQISVGKDALATNQMKFGRNSWFYTTVAISKFINCSKRRYKMFAQLILKLFEAELDLGISRSLSLNFSDDIESAPIIKSQSIQSLVDWISPDAPPIRLRRSRHQQKKLVDGLSLVICRNINDSEFGDNSNAATFFYPKHKICGSLSFMLSPKNSAHNIIARTLLSGETSKIEYPNLITEFTKLLICGDIKIEASAAMECSRIVNNISEELAKKIYNSIDKNSTIDSDMFLLSLLLICHSKLIPSYKYHALLNFLLKTSDSTKGCASLALSILLRGFKFWSQIRTETSLFSEFIKSFIKYDRPKAVEEMFFQICVPRIELFFTVLTNLIKENENDEKIIKSLVGLSSKFSLSNPTLCGTKIAYNLVLLAAEIPSIQDIIMDELTVHSLFMPIISILKEVIVIGQSDGTLLIFKNFKLVSSERLFDSPIDIVSIGPQAQFCCALSISERKAKVFSLHSQGFFSMINRKNEVEADLDGISQRYKVFWTDKKHCHFTVID